MNCHTDRRSILKLLADSAAGPLIIPNRLLAADVPSKKVTLGFIGVDWQGGTNLNNFLGQDDCQVLAICDVDENHRNNPVNQVNQQYGNKDCKAYKDFRELLACKDIDAVCISTPDHWHSIAAAKQQIIGDAAASKMISPKMRQPWNL